ncbi:Muramidase-2 precursor [compost metagenome]
MPDSFPAVADDIAFELLILHAVADRGRMLKGSRASALRTSTLWDVPAPLKRAPIGKRVLMHVASALVIASTLTLSPTTALPAWAQRTEIRMTIVDVETGKPLADVVLRDAEGNALARTRADGKLTFNAPSGAAHVTLERAGYQSVTLSRAQLGGNNLVSMRKTTKQAAPAARPTVKPTASPTAEPTPLATAKPTTKPTVKPTAKPVAKPTVKPTVKPAAQAAPKPAQRPETKPAPRREPHRTAAAGTRYVVKRGDTLWDIADATLGSPLKWPSLFAANRNVLSRPNLIHPGQTLVIPRLAARSRGTHQVRQGDTLWAIAESVYGNPLRWKDLYQANRAIIKRPSRIYPGQTLILPQ